MLICKSKSNTLRELPVAQLDNVFQDDTLRYHMIRIMHEESIILSQKSVGVTQ